MAESDAEWLGPEVNKPIGPNNPPPRPTSTVPPLGGGRGRRRCLNPPCRRRDAPDRDPGLAGDSGQTITIVVSVVMALFLVVVLLILLYMFVLRKKLRQMKRQNNNSQYGLRVEDVTHLQIDDSAKLYVNTTDLQKLVSSVRIKDRNTPTPVSGSDSENGNYPDVVKVGRPPAPLPLPKTDRMYGSVPTFEPSSPPKNEYEDEEHIYSNIESLNSLNPMRPAPPPPSAHAKSLNDISRASPFAVRSLSSKKTPNSKPLVPYTQKPSPPALRDKPKSSGKSSREFSVPRDVQSSHPTISKPNSVPPPPPTAKPSLIKAQQSRPVLPRLKLNLTPAVNRQDSEFSTPDTAISYLAGGETPSDLSPSFESRALSVKERRAMLEGVIAQ